MAFPAGNARLTVDERKLAEPRQPGSMDERLVQLIKDGLTIDEYFQGFVDSGFVKLTPR